MAPVYEQILPLAVEEIKRKGLEHRTWGKLSRWTRGKNKKAQPRGLGQDVGKADAGLAEFGDFVGLRPLLPLHDLKLDRVAFLQSFESFTLNGRVMNEDIRSAILADEAVTLGVIEPFHFPLKSCHLRPSLMGFEIRVLVVSYEKKMPRILLDSRQLFHLRFPDAYTVQTPGKINI